MYLITPDRSKYLFFEVLSEEDKTIFSVRKNAKAKPMYEGESFYLAWKMVMDVLGRDLVMPKMFEAYLG